jgi:hypothetical protein
MHFALRETDRVLGNPECWLPPGAASDWIDIFLTSFPLTFGDGADFVREKTPWQLSSEKASSSLSTFGMRFL